MRGSGEMSNDGKGSVRESKKRTRHERMMLRGNKGKQVVLQCYQRSNKREQTVCSLEEHQEIGIAPLS